MSNVSIHEKFEKYLQSIMTPEEIKKLDLKTHKLHQDAFMAGAAIFLNPKITEADREHYKYQIKLFYGV